MARDLGFRSRLPSPSGIHDPNLRGGLSWAPSCAHAQRKLWKAALEGGVDRSGAEAGQTAGLVGKVLPAAEVAGRLDKATRGRCCE